MEVLDGQKEVGTKYKTHFFTMFSQLFCTISEEVIKRFGDKGKEAIANGVKKYGEERGKRIANIVKSLGKELTLQNFFIYGDLDGSGITKYKIKIIDGNLEICKEWNKLEYGQIYCEYIR